MANKGKQSFLVAAIAVVMAAVLTAVNMFTAPIIANNDTGALFAPLYAVMPEASDFEVIYDGSDASTISGVADTVQYVYRETSGLGYVVRLSTTKGYTGEPIEFTAAIDAEGKISGMNLTAYPETKDFGVDTYPQSYVGEDSAMGGVQLVAGCTYASVAFKDAMMDGFNALIDNNLMAAGVKSDDQLLMELIPAVFSGMTNASGVAQYEEVAANKGTLTNVLSATNGAGFAAIVKKGDASVLAVSNNQGLVTVFDVEGNDVTESNTDVAGDLSAYVSENGKVPAARLEKKLAGLVSETAEISALELGKCYNTVAGAYSITDGGKNYYGFISYPFGYNNEKMTVFYVLDENGAIVTMTANSFILEAEYFSDYTLEEESYKAGFTGLTADAFTGEQALISGATVSTNAISTATSDVFAVFEVIGGAE